MVPCFLYYLVPGFVILYGIRKYRESKWGKCTNKVRLDGKIAVVTGSNCGIGFEVAKELLKRGAFVIFACRNTSAGFEAIKKIEKCLSEKVKADCIELDLASLSSIKTFADTIKSKYPKINILINNAGVSFPEDRKIMTKDGFEIHFGINHLGHFYLTNLLLDNMKNNDKNRIIIISSMLHEKGEIDLDDLNMEKKTNRKNAYANSKLANVYFCKELAKRTKGQDVNVYCVCPGWVFSSLFRHHIKKMLMYLIFVIPAAFLFMRSTKSGAQTVIYCATEPDLEKESGYFYRDCKKYEQKKILEDTISEKLWKASEELINLSIEDEL